LYFRFRVCWRINAMHAHLYLHFFLQLAHEAGFIPNPARRSGSSAAKSKRGRWSVTYGCKSFYRLSEEQQKVQSPIKIPLQLWMLLYGACESVHMIVCARVHAHPLKSLELLKLRLRLWLLASNATRTDARTRKQTNTRTRARAPTHPHTHKRALKQKASKHTHTNADMSCKQSRRDAEFFMCDTLKNLRCVMNACVCARAWMCSASLSACSSTVILSQSLFAWRNEIPGDLLLYRLDHILLSSPAEDRSWPLWCPTTSHSA